MKTAKSWFVPVVVLVTAVGLVTWAGSPQQERGRAPVPDLIPYQGVLERNGQVVDAIGSETVLFRVSLWDAQVGGNKVWPAAADVYDSHTVNVYKGRFSLLIGQDVPYVQVPGTELFLDVQVKMDVDPDFVQLSGRQAFLYTPYAIAANRADGDFLVAGDVSAGGNLNAGGSLVATGSLSAGADSVIGSPATGANLNVYGNVTANNLWTKVYENHFSNQPNWVISGLDGNPARVFKIVVHGSCGGSAGDWQILLQINGDSNVANYQSFMTLNGNGSGGEWGLGGLYLGRHAFGYGAAFLVEYDLATQGTAWTSRRVGSGKSMFAYTNGNVIAYDGGGAWGGTTPISSLSVVNAGGNNMSGSVTIFAMDR